MKKSHLTCFENSTWNGMVYGPTGNRVAWLPLYNLNCKARNTPVDKTGVNFSCCSQGVLRTVDAPSLLFRLNRALELIRCCEKELCEIQTCNLSLLFQISDADDEAMGPWGSEEGLVQSASALRFSAVLASEPGLHRSVHPPKGSKEHPNTDRDPWSRRRRRRTLRRSPRASGSKARASGLRSCF